MIESLALEKSQIEFIGDQPGCDVRGELRIAFDSRRRPWPEASVSRSTHSIGGIPTSDVIGYPEASGDVRRNFDGPHRLIGP